MRSGKREFERLVDEALATIPEEFRRHLDNVEIVTEDEPSEELRRELGMPPGDSLYGLYQGVPLTERHLDDVQFPDQVIVYRRPLLEDFEDPAELRHEIARTVIHELAHHFGIDEERLLELGWD